MQATRSCQERFLLVERCSKTIRQIQRYIASVTVADGSTCLLWDDCWNGQPLKLAFPKLYSFARKRNIFLAVASSTDPVSTLFSLPLSIEVYDQFQQIHALLLDLQPNVDNDTWTYIWGSFLFSSRKAYHHLKGISGDRINGYRNLHANTNINCSFGCLFKIG